VDGRISAFGPYRTAFKKVSGVEGISARTIPLAVATYERTIVIGKVPFGRWIEGDATAISDEAKQGFDLFNGKGNCIACHTWWKFTDNGFHDIGLPDKDIGRGEWIAVQSMQQAFKTPTLRVVDRRAP
jgi:cytochrome c peroxidase